VTGALGIEDAVSARYVFFYLMRPGGDGVTEAVPEHVAHWRRLELGGYLGGPFDDHSGGLITFDADDASQAEQAVAADPFIRLGLVQTQWLKLWRPEPIQ
jgi:uncharacterized protein YciI